MFDAADRLRALLASGRGHIAPGCHDAISSRLIQAQGFPAVYVPGYNVAASLGLPDLGIMTLSDMLERAGHIIRSTSLPVIFDAEGGYGTALNVAETVRRYEALGAAAIHLEDQVTPKLASAPKTLIPIDQLQAKIAAAVAARSPGGLVIIARTDAVATPGGLPDALRRARACEEAGADAVMVKFLTTREEVRETVRSLTTPLIFAQGETIRPTLPVPLLADEGCAMVLFTLTLMLQATTAQVRALEALKATGDVEPQLPDLIPFGELNRILDDDAYLTWEQTFDSRVRGREPT